MPLPVVRRIINKPLKGSKMERKKILVVEDEKNIRENIAELLELEDYDVHIACNGNQGLSKAINLHPDLILSDVMMPEVDGFELLRMVRNQEGIKNIPFIFITAKSERNDQRFAMGLGADDFILKPFSANELLEAVKSRFKRKEQIEDEFQQKISEIQFNLNNTSAHELNTPLNGIIGFSELLINYGANLQMSEMMQYIKMIYQSGIRLKQTVDKSILFRSLFILGKNGETDKSFCSGETLINEEFVKTVQTTIEEEQNLNAIVMIDVEAAQIAISEENLNRIVFEILENGYKFGTNGKPILVKGFLDGTRYHLEVTNYGRGMQEEEIASIGPFIQFNRKTFEQQGAGLGLYLVKRLTELNKGSLTIKSTPNEKTCVRTSFLLR